MAMLYLLIFLVAKTIDATVCPNDCTCQEQPRYPSSDDRFLSVRCIGVANLTETLPGAIGELIIVDVEEDLELCLDELLEKNISRLEIRNSNLDNVTEIHSQITTLKISQTLKGLPNFKLPNLTVLDLSQNNVNVLVDSFRTLLNLQVLNLSANSITIIKEKTFSGLSNLKSLDLSKNNLTVLTDKILIPLANLQHLNISSNHLEVLNEACFNSLTYLQQLDVSFNKLTKVIPGNLELPNLARLLLFGNPSLGKSTTLLVGTGSRLQTVDASNTGLTQVPSALTYSIRTLRLAENFIKSISCGDLDSYPLLQVLDLHGNKMVIIEEDALGRLESLSILYLSKNDLTMIPKSLPEKLEVLHLEQNKIQTVQSEDFQNFKSLQVLVLRDNNISSIEENAFNHLLALSSLDLSKNPLSTIQPGMLSLKLQSLRLANIQTILPAKEVAFPLSTPEYLIILDLGNSPGLAHQFLADTAMLAAAKELQEVNLSNAGLQFIRSDLLHYLPQLRLLHLRGNPLNCSDMDWLASWIRKLNEDENNDVICYSPPELYGTSLVDLKGLEFGETTKIKETTTQKIISLNKDVETSTEFDDTTIIQINKTDENATEMMEEDNNSFWFKTNLTMESNGNITISTSQLSMSKTDGVTMAYPGMLLLVLALLISVATAAILTSQCNKRRRRLSRQSSDIEVSSIPSVSELW